MEPLGVHHVSVNVRDVDEVIAFYVGSLGMTVRADRPDFGFGGAWLDVGDQQVHLIERQPPQAEGQHFAIRVASLDDAIAGLRAVGIEVSDPEPVGRGRQSFLSDPSGNLVELHQPA